MLIKKEYHLNISDLIDILLEKGYSRVTLVLSSGDFAVRGSIVDVFPFKQNVPVRIEFFDDDIEDIRTFEPNTQRSILCLKEVTITTIPENYRHKQDDIVIPHEILFNLQPGDYVVHIAHGLGLYRGLERMKLADYEGDYVKIEFQEEDFVYVPVDQLTRIYKFTGAITPEINSLRDNKWTLTKKKAEKVVKNVAKELFYLYKKRRNASGFSFPEDNELSMELDKGFEYEETVDQIKAISFMKQDMESDHPMDRLICGDVGFGKTEVAIRAAFKAVLSGKQVAFLAPTTILVQQHYKNLADRLSLLGVKVDYISRFKKRKEQLETLSKLEDGRIDVIVGTHRLLQKDVVFLDIGLLVIDEEQRFGVMAKEYLKQIRSHIDVLTLSATPLPRTLYLSISGVRDISVINTPPLKRLPIITKWHEFNEKFIKHNIEKELQRGGQVYFLHNFVFDIYHLQNKLQLIMPSVDIRVAHGQMKPTELESIVIDFYEGKFPVLLSTTIIENGVDIPNVHTIFIDNADRFGLSQLHQIRGRVGRDDKQSYAYLLYKNNASQEALDRFETLAHFSTLGSGYDISLRDLELRGIGNVLGTEQSGYMQSIGFEVYMHLLNNAIALEKGERIRDKTVWHFTSEKEAYIPEEYIPDMNIRLAIYKSMADIESSEDVDKICMECEDRFGSLPEKLNYMLKLIKESIVHK